MTSADSKDNIIREIFHVEHIFRTLGVKYEFVISDCSKLPLLISAPVKIPKESMFVCLFGNTADKDLTAVQNMFKSLGPRAMRSKPDAPELFEPHESLCIETMAHHFRQCAMMEPEPKMRRVLFAQAYALYRSVLYACAHPSVTSVAEDVKAMSKRILVVAPVANLESFSPDRRRSNAHCFAGMALCALMGKKNPVLFFGLSSAALAWEYELGLANCLRVILLLVGKFHLGLASLAGEWVLDGMDAVDALMGFGGSTLANIPAVYDAFTRQLILPAVVKHGSAKMLARERKLIKPESWEEVRGLVNAAASFFLTSCSQAHRFALSVLKRIEDRTTGKNPTPRRLTRIHVVDGVFAERQCGGCGVWQRDTQTKLDRCSHCRKVYYCSKECQLKDWAEHKAGCK